MVSVSVAVRNVCPSRSQRGAQLAVVVDLAVEDHPDGAVLVGDRLVAGRDVDDAQAPHAERDAVLDVEALVVRSAVADDVAHALQQRGPLLARGAGLTIPFDESRNPTHRMSTFRRQPSARSLGRAGARASNLSPSASAGGSSSTSGPSGPQATCRSGISCVAETSRLPATSTSVPSTTHSASVPGTSRCRHAMKRASVATACRPSQPSHRAGASRHHSLCSTRARPLEGRTQRVVVVRLVDGAARAGPAPRPIPRSA